MNEFSLLQNINRNIIHNGSKYSCQTGVIVENIKILITKNKIINLLFLNNKNKINKLKNEKIKIVYFISSPLKIINSSLLIAPPPKLCV